MKAEQIKEITEKATEQLVAALQQGHSETLTNYLKTIGRFHRYSLHNVLLFALQKPHASYVAGFRTWNQLGRFVKKGEKGILIALSSLLHFTLVLACAATALRASEILALRWSDLLWHEGRIRISKRWAKGKDGETKTEASDGYVPLHPTLAAHLRLWREQSPYSKDADFVFPSLRARGRVPLSASIFVADDLRPAAKKAGVRIEDGNGSDFTIFAIHSATGW